MDSTGEASLSSKGSTRRSYTKVFAHDVGLMTESYPTEWTAQTLGECWDKILCTISDAGINRNGEKIRGERLYEAITEVMTTASEDDINDAFLDNSKASTFVKQIKNKIPLDSTIVLKQLFGARKPKKSALFSLKHVYYEFSGMLSIMILKLYTMKNPLVQSLNDSTRFDDEKIKSLLKHVYMHYLEHKTNASFFLVDLNQFENASFRVCSPWKRHFANPSQVEICITNEEPTISVKKLSRAYVFGSVKNLAQNNWQRKKQRTQLLGKQIIKLKKDLEKVQTNFQAEQKNEEAAYKEAMDWETRHAVLEDLSIEFKEAKHAQYLDHNTTKYEFVMEHLVPFAESYFPTQPDRQE